jgi:hypothetical protein
MLPELVEFSAQRGGAGERGAATTAARTVVLVVRDELWAGEKVLKDR